jgi:hypothetical protein
VRVEKWRAFGGQGSGLLLLSNPVKDGVGRGVSDQRRYEDAAAAGRAGPKEDPRRLLVWRTFRLPFVSPAISVGLRLLFPASPTSKKYAASPRQLTTMRQSEQEPKSGPGQSEPVNCKSSSLTCNSPACLTSTLRHDGFVASRLAALLILESGPGRSGGRIMG